MIGRKRWVTVGWLALGIFGFLVLPGPRSGGVARAQGADAKEGKPALEAILRRTAEFYQKARTITVAIERAQSLGALSNRTNFEVAFERPNRFAIRSKEGDPAGITLVCDGTTMSTSIAALRKYTEVEAPKTFDDVRKKDPIVQAVLIGMMVTELFAADPYAQLMEGVQSTRYAGLETLDGAKAHHLGFTQAQFDWEMWVAADGDPLVRKVRLDLSKSMPAPPASTKGEKPKLTLTDTYTNWRIDAPLEAKVFRFQPPAGAQKVDSFFGGPGRPGGEPEPSPLLGKPAPDVDLKLLEKGEFQLKDHRGQHVVMIDFWATWCGPCVQEMPILAKVAASYKDKGVVFFAINQREKPDEIRGFFKGKDYQVTVALDPEGEVGGTYGVEGIPTLVLIDKKGMVQAVHVGYSPDIKTTLPKELDALLAGKDLRKEAPRGAAKPEGAAQTEGLEPIWSVKQSYTGVAADPAGKTLYALRAPGTCDVLDRGGATTRSFRIAGANRLIRFARRAGGAGGLLAFGPWGPSVSAFTTDGSQLWQENGGQGIDDVWAADLDGDAIDEVIVGYNGSTGLHLFATDGARRWKHTDLGNVWHVTAGDLDGDGKPEVVTTSAVGKVHVFAPDGKSLRTLDAGLYANMIRTAPGRPARSGDSLLVIGSGRSGEAMVALAGTGTMRWTLELPTGVVHCDSLAVAPDGAWAAAGLRGGRVCVIDLQRGTIAAQAVGQGDTPEVAWLAGAEPSKPLLVVATGRALNAFRVKPAAPASD
jgi:thiol-disulfide isomerase/thioredoxin